MHINDILNLNISHEIVLILAIFSWQGPPTELPSGDVYAHYLSFVHLPAK